MKLSVFARKLWACLIACAILLSSIVATVSHASVVSAGASTFSAICTATGIKWVDLRTDEIYDGQQAPIEVETSVKSPCYVCAFGFVGLLPTTSDFSQTHSLQSINIFSNRSDSIRQKLAFSQSNPRAPPRA